MAEIHVTDLVKTFDSVRALDSVSVTVSDGEVLAMLGPSGCGKTTLLRCIAGLEKPASGLIQMGGETLYSSSKFIPPSRRNISMVFQSYALWPHMTVAANVAYGLRTQKMPKRVIADRVAECLDLTGMSGFESRYPAELSGGQQQRVAVARALSVHADVVLFDEPLSNLDARLREELRGELKRVMTSLGVTGVYVTHDFGEAVVMADRIALMQSGRIVQVGTPEEIYHHPATVFAARFSGSVNLLEARVRRSEGRAELLVGDAIRLNADHAAATLPDGTSVHVVVRPEHVTVQDSADGIGYPAVVEDVTLLGQVTMVKVKVRGIEIQSAMLSRPSSHLAPGTNCSVCFDDDSVVILSPDDRHQTGGGLLPSQHHAMSQSRND